MDRAGHLMGYPMTFQRFLNRNRLADGDYGAKMSGVNVGETRTVFDTTGDEYQAGVDIAAVYREHGKRLETEINVLNARWGNLVGDLRRLQHDTVDEDAICQYIAERTSVDPDMVAIVLKEFMSW